MWFMLGKQAEGMKEIRSTQSHFPATECLKCYLKKHNAKLL